MTSINDQYIGGLVMAMLTLIFGFLCGWAFSHGGKGRDSSYAEIVEAAAEAPTREPKFKRRSD